MKNIQEIRNNIDSIDKEIIGLLVQRFFCSEKVAEQKIKNGLPVFDGSREESLFEKIEQYAKTKKLSPQVARKIFKEIVHQSRRVQEANMRNKNSPPPQT